MTSRQQVGDAPSRERAVEAEQSPSDRIMTAARHCFGRFGVAKTTIEDIAGEAGMSRASVYRHVPGGRDAIVLEVLAAEAEAMLAQIAAEASGERRLADQLTAALVANVDALRDEGPLAVMFSISSLATVTDMPGYFDTAVGIVDRTFRPLLADGRRRGELRPDISFRDVAEWLIRSMAGIVAYRSETTESRDRLQWFVRTFVVAPLLVRG